MAVPVTWPRRVGRIGLTAAVAGTIGLGVFAFRADQNAAGGQAALTALDLAVGVAFSVAGFTGTGPLPERLVVGAVGPAWLAGSVFGWALSLHQSVLAIALLAYPGGRVRAPRRMLLAAGGVLVASELVPQLAVAALFAVIAANAAVGRTPAAGRRAAAMYPVFAGLAVAIALCFAWWSAAHSAVSSPLVDYEIILLAVAFGFPLASRAEARSTARLADRVLGEAGATGSAGIAGLQVVLAAALDDPDLRIELGEESTGGADGLAGNIAGGAGPTVVPVFDAGQLVARVITASPSVTDRPTADAVVAAVRLVARNEELRALNLAQVRQLEAARARLLAAGDRERERTAARLRAHTERYLQDALNDLDAGFPVADPHLAAVIDSARGEIAAAAEQVQRIVAGVPPFPLGSGQLRAAITDLAASCPVPATADLNDHVAADIAVETMLFYVCSEALVNVAKHSAASEVAIVLRREGDRLVLTVIDDGVGSADPEGSGLRGLADRLAALGGHLLVSSPAGHGTTLRALVTSPEG